MIRKRILREKYLYSMMLLEKECENLKLIILINIIYLLIVDYL